MYLCVLCVSENKQRLFPYTALTDWFYNRDWGIYCAVRTGSLYIIHVYRMVWCYTRPGLAETVHAVYIVWSANTPNTENNQIYLNPADKYCEFIQWTDPHSRQKACLTMTNSRFQYTDLHRAMSPRKGSIPRLTDRTTDRQSVVDIVFALPKGRAGRAWDFAGQ